MLAPTRGGYDRVQSDEQSKGEVRRHSLHGNNFLRTLELDQTLRGYWQASAFINHDQISIMIKALSCKEVLKKLATVIEWSKQHFAHHSKQDRPHCIISSHQFVFSNNSCALGSLKVTVGPKYRSFFLISGLYSLAFPFQTSFDIWYWPMYLWIRLDCLQDAWVFYQNYVSLPQIVYRLCLVMLFVDWVSTI